MSPSPHRRKASALVQTQAREAERLLSNIREQLRKPVAAAFAQGDLTGPQRSVMQVLVASPNPLSINDLRRELGLAQSTVSGIVDRLVQRELIVRATDPADRRSILLEPTTVVRHFLKTQVPELSATPLAQALGRTTPARRNAILQSLAQLHELLQRPNSPDEQ
jgi:DNA-binding MarR family transcriptional regulator